MRIWSALGWMPVLISVAVSCFSASVQIGVNFTASRFGVDSSALPSDTMGAIGPSHFVEFLNGRFAVFDKATGKQLQSTTDVAFWTDAGVTLGKSVSVTDPRIAYDPDSGRWFAAMVDVNARRQRANRFLLAVSSSSDPAQGWQGLALSAAGGLSYFADFPTLGLDANGVYLSGDLFDLSGNPAGPILLSIPKASLLGDPPAATGMMSSGLLSYAKYGEIMQPAIATGLASTPEVVLAVGDLGLDFGAHSTLFLTPLKRTASSFALGTPVVLNVPSYEIPINPAQPGGSGTLDNGDTRFSASVRRVGDVLYAVHSTEVNSRSALRWYRIDAAQNSVIESGTITNRDLELFYPSIAANARGTVVIGCNGTSTKTFVSSFALVGQVANGALTFSDPVLLKSGLATYDTHDSSGVSRWGDYSSTTADPSDPGRFWTIQSYPVNSTTWATQVTELIVPNPAGPVLAFTVSGSDLEISWPATPSAILQTVPSLPAGAWRNFAGTPAVAGGRDSVIVSPSDRSAFFRLVVP